LDEKNRPNIALPATIGPSRVRITMRERTSVGRQDHLIAAGGVE
jgi:hypothetical protein